MKEIIKIKQKIMGNYTVEKTIYAKVLVYEIRKLINP